MKKNWSIVYRLIYIIYSLVLMSPCMYANLQPGSMFSLPRDISSRSPMSPTKVYSSPIWKQTTFGSRVTRVTTMWTLRTRLVLRQRELIRNRGSSMHMKMKNWSIYAYRVVNIIILFSLHVCLYVGNS